MSTDPARLSEAASIGSNRITHDEVRWHADWRVEKYHGDDLTAEPYEVIEREGNILVYGGASCLWQCLIGNGSTVAGGALTYFNNAQAAIGVGTSVTAAAATQTALQAATVGERFRKAMDVGYPTHTDGVVVGAASISFRSVFGTADANYAWAEWGLFNSATDATGRMLNRKVEALGTKASGSTWTFTITLTLA